MLTVTTIIMCAELCNILQKKKKKTLSFVFVPNKTKQ